MSFDRWMEVTGTTNAWMAKRLGISTSTISRIRSGALSTQLDPERLARAIDVRKTELEQACATLTQELVDSAGTATISMEARRHVPRPGSRSHRVSGTPFDQMMNGVPREEVRVG